MESLELLAAAIFANQPNDELTQQAYNETLRRMEKCYDPQLPKHQAELAVLLQCIAPQYAKSCRKSLQIQQRKEQFFKRYPIIKRTCLAAIILLPILFLALMFSVESKILFLTLWVTSILLFSAILIVTEYIKDYYARFDLQETELQEETTHENHF